MTLILPITLSIVRALLVRVQEETFALPLASVSEVVTLKEKTRTIEQHEVMTLRGTSLALVRVAEHFDLAEEKKSNEPDKLVAIAQVGERKLGLVVDAIVGQQDIVIKALSSSLGNIRGFSGATELGDQHVALVLDAAAIVEEVMQTGEVRELKEIANEH